MRAIILGNELYARPFEKFYDCTCDPAPRLETLHRYNLVVFTGGTDVDPALYGEERHHTTNIPDQERDKWEQAVFHYARDHQINMAGICRGAQFLTVMNGGKLVQHIHGHAIQGTHSIKYRVGQSYRKADITSTHHQMMYPWASTNPFSIIGHSQLDGYDPTSAPKRSGHLAFHTETSGIEVVWWPKTKCLCIQGHPEYLSPEASGAEMARDLF